MPTKEAAELQHSREFVEEQDAAVMRQTPVAKGDFHISRRSTHPDLNLTKSDVKVTMKICSGSPARSVRNSHPMPFFTPDSGHNDSSLPTLQHSIRAAQDPLGTIQLAPLHTNLRRRTSTRLILRLAQILSPILKLRQMVQEHQI